MFRGKYTRTVDRENRIHVLTDGSEDEIYKKIEPIVYTTPDRMKKEKIPAAFEFLELSLPPGLKDDYATLEKEGLLQINNQEQEHISLAKLGKCKQFTGGCVFHGILPNGKYSKDYDVFHNVKLDALKSLCKKVSNTIIVYEYQHEKERILESIPGCVYFDRKDDSIQDKWNQGKIKFLLCNSASDSMGLNLQFGGNKIIWYSLTWSYQNYYQMIGRIRRTGQPAKCVEVYHLIMTDTIDCLILEILRNKESGSEIFMKCLKNYIELKN
jgi:hypothetical protein